MAAAATKLTRRALSAVLLTALAAWALHATEWGQRLLTPAPLRSSKANHAPGAHDAQHSQEARAAPEAADAACLALRCAIPLTRCGLSASCRRSISCMQTCNDEHGRHTDLMCSSKCFFDYADPTFSHLTACGLKHNCLPHLTWSDLTCPDFSTRTNRVAHFDVARFAEAGVMYVARGSHKVYDCLPCQHLRFSNATSGVATEWSTALSSSTVRSASYTLQQRDANTLVAEYELFGMPVTEHYHMLDHSDDYAFVLYAYCGWGFGGDYQGAVVYSRERGAQLPAAVAARFDEVLRDNDLGAWVPPIDHFCTPDYSGPCPNIP